MKANAPKQNFIPPEAVAISPSYRNQVPCRLTDRFRNWQGIAMYLPRFRIRKGLDNQLIIDVLYCHVKGLPSCPSTSTSSPTATAPRPSSSARPGAKASASATSPSPTSPNSPPPPKSSTASAPCSAAASSSPLPRTPSHSPASGLHGERVSQAPRGNHRADSPPVAKPARKLFQTKVRLQTASPHAPVAPLPTPAPLDTREVDVSALA